MSQEPNLSFDDLFGSPTVSPQPELPESAAMENLSIGEPGAIPPPGTSGPAHTGDNEDSEEDTEVNTNMPVQNKKDVSLAHFELLHVIGEGGYGKVYTARKKDSGNVYAIKVLKKSTVVSKRTLGYIWAERNILASVRHPFLVSLRYSFQTPTKLYMVMDFISGGELFFHLASKAMFSEQIARFYGAEIVVAVQYLHSLGIIHRDLKPENVLLDSIGHVRVTDFGLAKVMDGSSMCEMEQYVRPSRPSEASSELQLDNGEGVPPREDGGESEQMAFSYCGTIDYMAPEVVKREEYGYAVDWWSVGCLLYHMMVGRAPFDDENGKFAVPNSFTPPGGNKKKKKPPQKKGNTAAQKKQRVCTEKVKLPAFLSSECHSLFKGLLDRVPSKRLGASLTNHSSIRRHPFFKGIHWQKLEASEIPPPITPPHNDIAYNINNFDHFYTSQAPVDDSPANSPTPFIGTFRNFSFDGGRYTDFELPDAAASSAGLPSLPTNQSANALEALEEEYSTDDITARSISLSCEKPIQSAVVGMTETMDRVESPDVFGRTPPFAMCSSQSPHAVSPLGVLGAMLQQRGLYTQEQAPIGDGTNTVAQTEIAAPPVDADIDDPPRVKVTQAEGEGKPTEATSATTFSFNPNAPAFVFNRG